MASIDDIYRSIENSHYGTLMHDDRLESFGYGVIGRVSPRGDKPGDSGDETTK